MKEGADPGYSLYDISDRLRLRGWQVPAFLLAGKASDITVMRVMCRRGFDMDMANLLIADFKAALAFLEEAWRAEDRGGRGHGLPPQLRRPAGRLRAAAFRPQVTEGVEPWQAMQRRPSRPARSAS